MALNLVFAKKAVSLWFFLFFLIIDLHFLVPSVIVQIFNFTAKLQILIAISVNEAEVEKETNPVVTETKISNYSR